MGLLPATVAGQFPSWYLPHNRVRPEILVSVALDDATGTFVYRYTVANGAGAEQRINALYMDVVSMFAGATAPPDWDVFWEGDVGTVAWSAAGTVDPAWTPMNDVDPPSFQSEIASGASLAGFELRSACGASGLVPFFALGYNHVAEPPVSDSDEAPDVPNWRDDAVRGLVLGPGDCRTVQDWGNRRPGVDGFAGLVNFASGATLPAGPVTVQVRFARSGEQVDGNTFHAELNATSVTARFRSSALGDRIALFEIGSSPLQSGRNVLLVSVEGIVPGTTRTGTDADRFTFTVP